MTDVPTFKGNAGNLLQHWPCCEIVVALHGSTIEKLSLLDAHGMAPLATPRGGHDAFFTRVRQRLSDDKSPYCTAWRKLTSAQPRSYPSTASFLSAIWPGELHVQICEIDQVTAEEIRVWLETRTNIAASSTVHEGDWRTYFKGAPTEPGDATLVSFDPYMFNRHGPTKSLGNMWPDDLDIACKALGHFVKPTVLQISSYSTNNDNPYTAVVPIWKDRFHAAGFKTIGVMQVKSPMMVTAFFGRNLGEIEERARSALFTARRALFAASLADVSLSVAGT